MQLKHTADIEPSVLVKAHYYWRLWTHGTILYTLAGLHPVLESWNSKTHPDQIKLQTYLDSLQSALAPILANRTELFLHMEIDVANPRHLLHNHDLENYLTPVVRRLGASHFILVSAIKRVGSGSQLTIGIAQSLSSPTQMKTWNHFSCSPHGSASSRQWKIALQAALAHTHPSLLPPGPVEVQLAWRCSPNRNWVNLWKPTGDTMGPVLGIPNPSQPFNPADDRITSLSLHLNTDTTMGHDVDVGMWWRPLSSSLAIPPIIDGYTKHYGLI